MKKGAHSRGFTLIELLMIVSMIAILAAIAVPNFLEAQIRSKVTKTRQEFEFIAIALETYYSDHGMYPHVPLLIKSNPSPISEEIIMPGEAINKTTALPDPFMMPMAEPFMVEPSFPQMQAALPPQTEAPRVQPDNVQKKIRALVYADEGITTSSLEFLMDKTKNRWRPIDYYYAEPYRFYIITPSTVMKELSTDEVQNTRTLWEALRFGFFKPEPVLFSYNQYPTHVLREEIINQNPFYPTLYCLTSPVNYLSKENLYDSFARYRYDSYIYTNFTQIDPHGIHVTPAGQNMMYMLLSRGPDNDPAFALLKSPVYELYDPTNGTVSPGDLIRWSETNNQ